mmetsp:Transcript_44950/g.94312  ORF Transcript_44950/g.94312 Transcript_44950/m.94312 type:complete len:225 (-) Transcript_44950:169-843(-)
MAFGLGDLDLRVDIAELATVTVDVDVGGLRSHGGYGVDMNARAVGSIGPDRDGVREVDEQVSNVHFVLEGGADEGLVARLEAAEVVAEVRVDLEAHHITLGLGGNAGAGGGGEVAALGVDLAGQGHGRPSQSEVPRPRHHQQRPTDLEQLPVLIPRHARESQIGGHLLRLRDREHTIVVAIVGPDDLLLGVQETLVPDVVPPGDRAELALLDGGSLQLEGCGVV